MTGWKRATVALRLFTMSTTAILVAKDSPCGTSCGNVLDSTNPDDIMCDESRFTATSAGQVFQSCINCERGSTYSSGNDTDLKWLLYNLRYAFSSCIFDTPKNPGVHEANNPCMTSNSCGAIQNALQWGNFTKSSGTLDYCNAWDELHVQKCSQCVVDLQNGHYVNNYLIMLDAACQQQPEAGSTISVSGNPFSVDAMLITTPSPTLAALPAPDFGPISLGARVGIAFGALAFLLAMAGFCIVMVGKRRRRAFLRQLEKKHAVQGWPHPKDRYDGSTHDMFETPVSQRPLRGWDESPVSAAPSTGPLPRYFSPYSSQFSSPVSASDGGPSAAHWPVLAPQKLDHVSEEHLSATGRSPPPPAFAHWPSATEEKMMLQIQHEQHMQRQQEIAIGLALGGDEASLRSKASSQGLQAAAEVERIGTKGKNRDESYELQESPYSGGGSMRSRTWMPTEPQAPVLHHPHPGLGRQHSASSRSGTRVQYGLTEEDAKQGDAV